MKCLAVAMIFAMLSVGCSDKKEVPNELNKQSEIKEKILENSSDVIDIRLEGPKSRPTHGKLCLEGCRGLPCDETARCVKRNCPSVEIKCEDDGQNVLKDKKNIFDVKPQKKFYARKGVMIYQKIQLNIKIAFCVIVLALNSCKSNFSGSVTIVNTKYHCR